MASLLIRRKSTKEFDLEQIIQMRNIVKRYYIGEPNELEILHGINLDIFRGEFLSIVGASGSGKSTLMNIIGLLDRLTEGSYLLMGEDTAQKKDENLSKLRSREIGFVFQNFNLIPRLTAQKNVELPMLYSKVPAKERAERAMELLELVEMADRKDHAPNELSGGQKQRVAIARALANDPHLILADEPTGALDSKTGHLVMDLFIKLNEEQNRTIVLITHNQDLAKESSRLVHMVDGRLDEWDI